MACTAGLGAANSPVGSKFPPISGERGAGPGADLGGGPPAPTANGGSALSCESGTRTTPSVALMGAQRSAAPPGGRSGALLLTANDSTQSARTPKASPTTV